MKVFANVTTFHVSLAAMLFVLYGALSGQHLVLWIAIAVVCAERVLLQFMIFMAMLTAKKMGMQAAAQIKFQMEEMAKAFQEQLDDRKAKELIDEMDDEEED